jgi:1D-myo-inositol-tetrakisphosphate 5-kinase/inositol-polyphosphate multikinase
MLLSGYDHQVAGHKEEALLGIGGRFILKPMVKPDLFKREAEFYNFTQKNTHDTNCAARFTAKYYGILHCKLDEGDATGENGAKDANNATLPHIVLEDLTFAFRRPSVLDIKMGRCTFEPTASREKKEREVRKYPHQAELGFRVTGFKVFDRCSDTYLKAGKAFGRSVAPEEASGALGLLFSDSTGQVRDDVLSEVLVQLENLWLWMKGQNRFHFYCSSLLIVYDSCRGTDGAKEEADARCRTWSSMTSRIAAENSAEMLARMREHMLRGCNSGEAGTPLVRVKMIDFAHVVEAGSAREGDAREDERGCGEVKGDGGSGAGGEGSERDAGSGGGLRGVDEGYLHGLASLIKHLRTVLDEARGATGSSESPLQARMAAMRRRAQQLG